MVMISSVTSSHSCVTHPQSSWSSAPEQSPHMTQGKVIKAERPSFDPDERKACPPTKRKAAPSFSSKLGDGRLQEAQADISTFVSTPSLTIDRMSTPSLDETSSLTAQISSGSDLAGAGAAFSSSSRSTIIQAYAPVSHPPCVQTARLRSSVDPYPSNQTTHSEQRLRLSASPSPCLTRNSSYRSTAGGNKRQRGSDGRNPVHINFPVKLPQPEIVILSDPYKDLSGHLRRHGLFTEAQAFAEAGVPANYVLHGFMTAANGGPPALLDQTSKLLVKHKEEVARQMAKSKLDHTTQNAASALPESLTFDLDSLDPEAEAQGLTPTHIVALHSSLPERTGRDGASTSTSRNGMLLPIHALPYVLQCVSLPALPSTSGSQAAVTTGTREVPVVSLRIPNPQAFPTMHRFIYNHDTTELLCSLLPIRYITTTLNRDCCPLDQGSAEEGMRQGSSVLPKHFTVTRAVHALSTLPMTELLAHAKQVHSAWANGIAVGLLSHLYWSTLDRAWDIIMGAMTLKRGREVVEAEMERTLSKSRRLTPDMAVGSVAEKQPL